MWSCGFLLGAPGALGPAAWGQVAGLRQLLFTGDADKKPVEGVADTWPVGRHRGAVLDERAGCLHAENEG